VGFFFAPARHTKGVWSMFVTLASWSSWGVQSRHPTDMMSNLPCQHSVHLVRNPSGEKHDGPPFKTYPRADYFFYGSALQW